ncbi:SCO2524 family protein [Streptomyces capoamus]|uniref:SCO2524 family protein n=1 Tax=Streptomyces capoamus TaxID=68183 RepID=UPI003397E604
MLIELRRLLLDIWQALARHSFDEGEWSWGAGGGLSSVADAERLLCLLRPATEIAAFRLDDPDTTGPDVARALRNAGDPGEIPRRLVEVLGDFMAKHRGEDGPAFGGGSCFAPQDPARELSEEQRRFGVVDSYSMSVSLCLAVLGFLQVYRGRTRQTSTLIRVDRLRDDTSARLTAAMVGLLRSFTVGVVDHSSAQGRDLIRFLGQGRLSDRQVLRRFRERFTSLRALITESVTLGLDADVRDQLRGDERLFECGWGWSVVEDAPEVTLEPTTAERIGSQPRGVASPVPCLSFTVVALDGIEGLLSERTLVLGLLDAEQQKLAEALRLRWEITRQYWSVVARFHEDAWPLEHLPRHATLQGPEPEYFSLCVASILVHDLMRHRTSDDRLTRVVGVLERLAERGRITSGAPPDDPAVRLHDPGVTMSLPGSEKWGPAMTWRRADFSAQLLKPTVQLCGLSRDAGSQDRLLTLAERILDHLWHRRISEGEGVGLWDDVDAVRPASSGRRGPLLSWSLTRCMTECMVAAHAVHGREPIRSDELSVSARAVISEAAHLFGRELMRQPAPHSPRSVEYRGVDADLRRARQLVDQQPGTAYALALGALARLDALARVQGDGLQGA